VNQEAETECVESETLRLDALVTRSFL